MRGGHSNLMGKFYLFGELSWDQEDLKHHLSHPFRVTLRTPLFRQILSITYFKGAPGSNAFCSLLSASPHQFHFHPATPGWITIF